MSSGDNFYCNMVLTSIAMLRRHNGHIPVRVFLIDKTKRQTNLDIFSKHLKFDVCRRPPLDPGYFCHNREYLSECTEDSVLHIDGDTFIFSDVERLFDTHSLVDFAGATDDWITGTPDWSDADLKTCYKLLGCNGVPVFNGGITLWNNRTIRDWADGMRGMCDLLLGKLPLPWLFRDNRNGYHRETFSVCFHIAARGLTYGIMGKKEVVNLFGPDDLAAWGNKDYVIYHCFTQNWSQFARQVYTVSTNLTADSLPVSSLLTTVR